MKKPLMVLALSILATTFVAGLAGARPPYYLEFKGKYYKPDGDITEKEFAKKVDAAGCRVCHGKNDEGKADKKIRNVYGKALAGELMKNEKNKEKIKKALDTVYDKKVPDGTETYGDRIKAGKLPAGD